MHKMNRRTFIFWWSLISVTNAAILSVVVQFMGFGGLVLIQSDPTAKLIILYGSIPAVVLIALCVAARCRDADLPVLYAFASVVPVINVPFLLALLFVPSIPGSSRRA